MHDFVKLVAKHQISANQLVLIHCLAQLNTKLKDLSPAVSGELSLAFKNGLIDESQQLTPKALVILSEAARLFKPSVSKYLDDPIFIERVNEYRNLFPNMKLPSGKAARSNVEDLSKKLANFLNKYPQYDWNLILDAAEHYVEAYRKNEYKFMKTASYYISKDNESDLASDCEFLLEGGDPQDIQKSYFTIL